MKKILLFTLALSFCFAFTSCEEEGEDEAGREQEKDMGKETFLDRSIIGGVWTCVTEKDSVVLGFSPESNYALTKQTYKKNDGRYEYSDFTIYSYFFQRRTYKDGRYQDFFTLYERNPGSESLEIDITLNENILTIPDWKGRAYVFEKQSGWKYSTGLLDGKWSGTMQVDSIIVVFEEEKMKEYLYEKGATLALERIDYGGYSLYKQGTAVDVVYGRFRLKYYESISDNTIYFRLEDDILTLFDWRSKELKLKKISD